MENSIKRKINVFGKVAKIITMIIIVCLLLTEGFMLAGGIIIACVPKDSVTVEGTGTIDVNVNTEYFGLEGERFYVNTGSGHLALGEISTGSLDVKNENGNLNVNGDFRQLHFDLNDGMLMLVYGMVYVAAIVVALFFFRALMKQFMVCDSPFSEEVVKKMRAFAIALIPCIAAVQIMKSAISAKISGSFSFDIDLISVAFVIIIFILTMIFKYGTELQKEHDETV